MEIINKTMHLENIQLLTSQRTLTNIALAEYKTPPIKYFKKFRELEQHIEVN